MLSPSERYQQEIDLTLEQKAHVTYGDRHNMPYMQVGALLRLFGFDFLVVPLLRGKKTANL